MYVYGKREHVTTLSSAFVIFLSGCFFVFCGDLTEKRGVFS